MRLWFIHPKYLDTEMLVITWKNAIKVKQSILNRQPAFTSNSQVKRILSSTIPMGSINTYLNCIYEEANQRGFGFDERLIGENQAVERIPLTKMEIIYELNILKKEMVQKGSNKIGEVMGVSGLPELNDLFTLKVKKSKKAVLKETTSKILNKQDLESLVSKLNQKLVDKISMATSDKEIMDEIDGEIDKIKTEISKLASKSEKATITLTPFTIKEGKEPEEKEEKIKKIKEKPIKKKKLIKFLMGVKDIPIEEIGVELHVNESVQELKNIIEELVKKGDVGGKVVGNRYIYEDEVDIDTLTIEEPDEFDFVGINEREEELVNYLSKVNNKVGFIRIRERLKVDSDPIDIKGFISTLINSGRISGSLDDTFYYKKEMEYDIDDSEIIEEDLEEMLEDDDEEEDELEDDDEEEEGTELDRKIKLQLKLALGEINEEEKKELDKILADGE